MVAEGLAWQGSLLAGGTSGPPRVDVDFAGRYRHHLDAGSWIDVVPGWVSGADDLFAALASGVRWRARDRVMFGQRVAEPRLTAGWKNPGVITVAPVLADAARVLSRSYGRTFDTGGLNLYRDGNDSVAWHRDRIPAAVHEPVVAILTLGATRRFLVRPYGGGPSTRFDPAAGDLIVTGGLTQRRWEHTVPKTASGVGPRISVTFRHR